MEIRTFIFLGFFLLFFAFYAYSITKSIVDGGDSFT